MTTALELTLTFASDELKELKRVQGAVLKHKGPSPWLRPVSKPGIDQPELVIQLTDKDGQLLKAWGCRLRDPFWVHAATRRASPVLPGWVRRRRPPNTKILRVGFATNACFALFCTHTLCRLDPTDVKGRRQARSRVVCTPLAICRLRPDIPPPASLTAAGLPSITQLESVEPAEAAKVPEEHDASRLLEPEPFGKQNQGRTFDIVVTGDGFTAGDEALFKGSARRLIKDLRSMEPFRRHGLQRYVNWHIIRAISAQRIPVIRSDERGNARRRGRSATYFGVRYAEYGEKIEVTRPPRESRITKVRRLPGGRTADVVILILNTEKYGGRGWATLGVAGVTRCQISRGLAAHECGHAIAGLAEEDIGRGADPTDRRPNKATLREVGGSVKRHLLAKLDQANIPEDHPLRSQLSEWEGEDSVWWRKLARGGKLEVAHTAVDPEGANRDPVGTFKKTAVGAFWGCEDLLVGAELDSKLREVLGAGETGELRKLLTGRIKIASTQKDPADAASPGFFFFYRPSPQCCMRKTKLRFYCPVCAHCIANSIRRAAGVPLKKPYAPAYHENDLRELIEVHGPSPFCGAKMPRRRHRP